MTLFIDRALLLNLVHSSSTLHFELLARVLELFIHVYNAYLDGTLMDPRVGQLLEALGHP